MPTDAAPVLSLDEYVAAARREFVSEARAAIAAGHSVTAVAQAGGVSRQYLHRLLAEQ